MTQEEFVTFEKFNTKDSAEKFAVLIKNKNIPYLIENNSLSFDPTFANNGFGVEYCLKIRQENFEEVNKILLQKSEEEIENVDKDYYLYSFSDEELIDVISKSDEWNKFDISLAKKILNEKRIDVSEEKINSIKEERILELSKPEKDQTGVILFGYFSAFLGGIWAFFIGWHLLTNKKTLPNGNRIYAYSNNDRKHGNRIFILGILFSIIWLLYFILK